MSELITIIVPIYNAEEFLDRCINSILKQTYQDIEVLLIDDGSTDQSFEICSNWKRKDGRLKLFSQKNSGVGSARNAALKKAIGRYIAFVDADDFIDTQFCEKMIKIVKQNNSDIAFCETNKIYKNKRNDISGNDSGKIVTIKSKEFEYCGYKERRSVWGALYRADVLSNNSFPENIAVGEDTVFLARAIKKAVNITYYDRPLYNYTVLEESAYHGRFSEKKATEIDAWIETSKIFDFGSISSLSAEALCAEIAIEMIIRYAGDSGFDKEHTDRLVEIYREKLPYLIKYDCLKKRKIIKIIKHIVYGVFPDAYVRYRNWKNEKKYRNL